MDRGEWGSHLEIIGVVKVRAKRGYAHAEREREEEGRERESFMPLIIIAENHGIYNTLPSL